jgi:transcriptional regulator with XRE-family HTH domain
VSGHSCRDMTIAAWLRAKREALGWSQDELAFRSHVSPRLIGRYERGEGEPSLANLLKLTDALGEPLPFGEAASGDQPTGRYRGQPRWPIREQPYDLAHVGG